MRHLITRIIRLSLWKQVVLVSLIANLGIIFVSGIMVRYWETSYLVNNLHQHSRNTFALLTATTIDAVITEDIPLLQTIVDQSIKSDPRILSMEMKNESGVLLATRHQSQIKPLHEHESFSMPIIFEEETFGTISIKWLVDEAYEGIENHVNTARWFLCGTLFLLTIIIAAGIHWLTVKPILKIHKTLVGLLEEQPAEKLKLSASHELELVADSTNMLSNLLHLQKIYKRELEKQVEERTHELGITNKQLKHEITIHKKTEEKRRQLEARLFQSQKMESLGTLAGGIAHDFNNLLTPMVGYLELAANELPQDATVEKYLQHVLNGAMRAKELVVQILAFSRQSDEVMTAINLNKTLVNAVDFLRRSLPSTVEINCDIEAPSLFVMASPAQIYQLVLNLGNNAADALQDNNGQITIGLASTDNEPSGKHPKLIHLTRGDYACITVTDSGIGMTQATLDRIYEPFFTTKEVGEGCGLGMSVVHGITTQTKGEVFVESTLGNGTTVQVYLPICSHIKNEEESGSGASCDLHEQGRILIVNDDDAITLKLSEALEKLGYSVTSTSLGKTAFMLLNDSPKGFYDLLIADLTMPEMTGQELIRTLGNHNIDIPIVVMSDYGYLEPNLGDRRIVAHLNKPLDIQVLKTVVNDELG